MTSYSTDIVNTLTFGEDKTVEAFAFCARGKKLAIRFASGKIWVVDLDTLGKIMFDGYREALAIDRVAFTPDGDFLVSARGYGGVEIFTLSCPAKPPRIVSVGDMINDLALTRDGATIIAATRNGVSTCDFATGALNRRYIEHERDQWGDVHLNVILPVDDAGARILVMEQTSIILLQSAEGISGAGQLELVRRYRNDRYGNYNASEMCMCVMPDKEHFLYGARDGWMRLWNIESGEVVRAWKNDAPVYSIALFGNQERLLLSGPKRDGDYWKNISTRPFRDNGKAILLLDGEDADIIKMATSPDCSLIATAGKDGNVVIRRVSVVEMKAAGRRI